MDQGTDPSPPEGSPQGAAIQPAADSSDISRILAELQAYTAARSTSIPPAASSAPQSSFNAFHDVAKPVASSIQQGSKVQRHDTTTPPSQPRTPLIDPSTIFEWPAALRCVVKMASSNPQFSAAIKGLMADQDRNARQWWEDRNNLVKSQEEHGQKIRDLNSVLKHVGGELQAEPTAEENKVELEKFDQKLYRASQQMMASHASELKRLGVPFFGVNSKLIIANDLQQTVAARDPLSKATLTQDELLGLQRKMIDYLQDMYGEMNWDDD